MNLKVRVEGLDALEAKLQAMGAKMGDLTSPLTQGAEEVKKFIDDRFQSSTDPSGVSWEPLKESTILRKGHNTILRGETGFLKSGFNATANSNSILINNPQPYASVHQTGGSRIPKRSMVPTEKDSGPTSALMKKIVGYISKYLGL